MFLDLDKQDKNSTALIDDEGNRISYGTLTGLVKDFGRYVEPRTVVFVLCRNTVGAMLGYLSFVEHDAIPLVLSEKIDKNLLDALIAAYTPRCLWLPESIAGQFPYATVCSSFGYVMLRTGYPTYPVNEELQFLMTTSGSTGSPKLVRYKKGNLEANAKNVALAFGWTKDERPVCDLGMQYTMGLNVINTHLYVGATILLTTHNLMSGDFWDYVKKERATNFTGVPFSYDILYRLRFEKMDLPDLTTLAEGGGKLTDARFMQLAEYAQRTGKRFIASFGTTETSARMACLPAELALTKTGSIGRAIPEGELFLIGEDGAVLTDKVAEGEMCYRGPNVTMGYAQCKEDLLKGDEFKGEYHTGDLARRDEDGCYYVTGRLSRFLKLLGYRVSLDQCERLIQQQFNIECACSGTDQCMNVYVVNTNENESITNYLEEKLGLYRSLFKVISVNLIPRNESGKIKYEELNASLLRSKRHE